MDGTAPTPSVRNNILIDPLNTFRAYHVDQMWRTNPAIPNQINLTYDIGIPAANNIGIFSFQNLTLNADLRVTFSIPPFLILPNGNRFIALKSSITQFTIGINEEYLKTQNPKTETINLTISVEPFNFVGPVYVQTDMSIPPNHNDVPVEHSLPQQTSTTFIHSDGTVTTTTGNPSTAPFQLNTVEESEIWGNAKEDKGDLFNEGFGGSLDELSQLSNTFGE